jgi:hypothetical protein
MERNKLKLLFLILVSVITYNSYSYTPFTEEQQKIIVPSTTRSVNDLSGNWQLKYSDDDSENETVKIPSSNPEERKIILTRSVKIPDGMLDKNSWHLNFLGIDSQIEVYWNDQFVGRYFEGLVPFIVRIPDNLISSKNNQIKLVIFPPAEIRKEIKTFNLFAKKIYTGAVREIFLIGTPQIWINEVQQKTTFSNSFSNAKIDVNLEISSGKISRLIDKLKIKDSLKLDLSEKLTFSYSIQLIDKQTGTTLVSSEKLSANIESERTLNLNASLFASNFNLWSPANPYLYDLVVKISKNDIAIDDYKVEYGFRDIKLVNNGNQYEIQLNGQPFKIKGVSYIEDFEGNGQTLDANRLKEDIESIKTLGANVIRAKFNPPNPYLVHLCNKRGLFLMIELPIYDQPISILKLNEVQVQMQNIAYQHISAFDYNPSILAWGISDGINEDSPELDEFYKKIINMFRQNSSHLIYKIVPFGSKSINTSGFDFIGLRDAQLNKPLENISSEFQRLKALANNKPVFIDFGSVIQPKNHGGYSDPLSIESQSFKILNYNKIISMFGGAGIVFNTYNDYIRQNPLLIANNEDFYINTSGLLDRSRSLRLSYSTLQSIFNDEKEPLLTAGSFKQSTPVIFIIIGLLIAIIVVLIINRFRRFREYMFRSLLRPYNFYADIRDQRIISTMLTLVLGILISASTSIYLSSIFYFYRDNLNFQYISMLFLPFKSLQNFFFQLVWMPELSMLMFALISVLLAVFSAGLIKLFAAITRAKIWFNDCLTLSIWAGLPSLLLLPLAIVLFRILIIYPGSIWIFISLYFLTALWTISRLAKSISVVFDIQSIKVYAFTFIFILIFVGIPVIYYQLEFSIFSYLNYFFEVLIKV